MLEKLISKLPKNKKELIDDIKDLSYFAVIEEPYLRGVFYGSAYFVHHDNIPMLNKFILGLVGIELFLNTGDYYLKNHKPKSVKEFVNDLGKITCQSVIKNPLIRYMAYGYEFVKIHNDPVSIINKIGPLAAVELPALAAKYFIYHKENQ